MRQLKISKSITNREEISLQKYLNEIALIPMINAEEEVILAQKIRAGDLNALENLTKANLRFVVSVAKQYQNKGLSLADMINEGNVGLIKAAQRFDETRGFKFITYAAWWIRQAITQALTENSTIIRIPANKIVQKQKALKVFDHLHQVFEREPTFEELAEITEISFFDISTVSLLQRQHRSLDEPIFGEDGREVSLFELIEDKNTLSTDWDLAYSESLKKELLDLVKKLTPRESSVLKLFFGIDGHNSHSLEEIGKIMSVHKERIRQIRDKAIRKLRAKASKGVLQSYVGMA